MARKTAYENEHMTLQKKQGNDKDTKKRVWQYLYEHQGKCFSATQLAKALEGIHRSTVSRALVNLEKGKPIIEQKTEYRVYRFDSDYGVFSKIGYEKYIAKQASIENRIQTEADVLRDSKMWTADKAEDLNAEVIFYPIAEDKRHFRKAENSLKKLFGKHIIAILAGNKEGDAGLFIIIKPHKNITKTKEHITALYSNITSKKTTKSK